MSNFDQMLESGDEIFIIRDGGAGAPTSGQRQPVAAPCACGPTSSDDDRKYANPWDRITQPPQNNLKCQDIFMGNVDCNLNVPCCCGLQPKTPQIQSDSRKTKSTKKKLSKKKPLCLNTSLDSMPFNFTKPRKISKQLSMTAGDGCNSCAKSRQYLDYLAKTLESFKAMNLCPRPTCDPGAGAVDSGAPKRRKRRPRAKRSPALPPPRCCCPAPCGALDTHLNCVDELDTVPKHMGWNWKPHSTERKGWRPGAIPRSIRELMCHFLKPCPCDTLPPFVGAGCGPPPPSGTTGQSTANCIDQPIPQRPMIRVHRKNDEYVITMNPLKSAQQLKTEHDPYMNCDPVQVRITANREDQRIAQIKQVIRESGFRRCKCGQPVAQCSCRDNRELEALRQCIANCGTKFGIDDLATKLSLNRLKDLELEFTPPAGVVKCCLQSPPSQGMQETQYNENDLKAAKGGDKEAKASKKDRKKSVGK